MPCTITLTTSPAVRRLHRLGVATEYSFWAPTLTTETIVVHRLDDIADEVKAFGERIRASAPEVSFAINLRVATGHRKLRGYDAAYLAGTFGQDAFMRVIDETVSPAAVS